MKKLSYSPGEKFTYLGQPVTLLRIAGLTDVQVEYTRTGATGLIPLSGLQLPSLEPNTTESTESQPNNKNLNKSPEGFSQAQWDQGRKRLAIIQPLIDERTKISQDSQIVNIKDLVKKISTIHKIGTSTLYRWLLAYDKAGSVVGLINQTRKKGITYVEPLVDELIRLSINEIFLTKQRSTATKVVQDVQLRCHEAKIQPPSESTIRRQIDIISQQERLSHRIGRRIAGHRSNPIRGHFPGADYPLAVIQIDHTPVDIILVDEEFRKPVGRPYLTIAIDVFSRMITGFYLSFDPPGFLATGMCISNAILPKETWLSQLNVGGEWPCWGTMKTIHVDNAKEFRGESLQRACESYGIRIDWRPVATPHWGGHVERIIGTINKEVHNLPGTTFSNIAEKANYNSEENAALTLPEFETWLTNFIVNIYHIRPHKSLDKSPLTKYKEGILGNGSQPGTGLPDRIHDVKKVRLDFLPFIKRSIQRYGVILDHIHYYDDILRGYIHHGNHLRRETNRDTNSGRKNPRQFIFKYDPRDLSCVYFLEPETNMYHRIPYRDGSHPPISRWEYNAIRAKLKAQNKDNITESTIFTARQELKEQTLLSIEKTKKVTKQTNRFLKERNQSQKNSNPPLLGNLDQPSIQHTDMISGSTIEVSDKLTPDPNIYKKKYLPFSEGDIE